MGQNIPGRFFRRYLVAESDEELVGELESLAGGLKEQRQPWESLWKDVWRFCYPRRLYYAPEYNTASKRPKSNYNNRALLSLMTASRGFQGYTANRRETWGKLQFEDAELNKQTGVSDYLEDCERMLYGVFSRSSLYEALDTCVTDGYSCGTSPIYIEEDSANKRIVYQARHPLSVWIAENQHGEVDTLREELYLTNKAALQRFPKGFDETSKNQMEKAPYKSNTYYHFVMPMDTKYLAKAQAPRSQEMPFLSLWYDSRSRKILDAGGYWEFPYSVWRMIKVDGDPYGGSAGQDALGDVLAANQMARSRIQLGNLIGDPPLTVPSELEGEDQIIPGIHIYMTKDTQKIEPIAYGANYPITLDNEKRQDEIIEEHFNVDLYQMLQKLEKNMTAREVIERTGEKAACLGPITSRYETDCLQKIIHRSYNILNRMGALPPPPQAVAEARKNGAPMKIVFLGFLSQVQQRYYQTSGINASLQYIQAVGSMSQASADNVDFDELMRESLESAGAPARVIREEKEVKQLRAQRAQAQAAAQKQALQMQQSQELMKNSAGLAKAPEPGSPLEGMGEALQQQQGAAAAQTAGGQQ
jgi:hypothetical protein